MDSKMPTQDEIAAAREALARACEQAVKSMLAFGEACKQLQGL